MLQIAIIAFCIFPLLKRLADTLLLCDLNRGSRQGSHLAFKNQQSINEQSAVGFGKWVENNEEGEIL